MVSLGRGLKYNKFKMTSQPSNVILISQSDLSLRLLVYVNF